MISASLPGEALAQLGQLSHLYPTPAPPPGITQEFLPPPPRPYARYATRPRGREMAPSPFCSGVGVGGVAGYGSVAGYANFLYRSRAQFVPRVSSAGFIPPAPAPRSPPAPPPLPSPPVSPERAPTPYFCRGALIRLEDGSLRRVEEMRTEDFAMSAERCGDLTLTQCTLLRLDEKNDRLTVTLTYNRNRSQVELDSTPEHPFFVYGRGWASFRPERTLRKYGLRVQRLQVGDVCVSLVARKHNTPQPAPLNTPLSAPPLPPVPLHVPQHAPHHPPPPQTQPENLSVKEDARKRRWSAPDVPDDDIPPHKKRLV